MSKIFWFALEEQEADRGANGVILREARRLLESEFHEVIISLCPRSGNEVAHCLAGVGNHLRSLSDVVRTENFTVCNASGE